MSRLAVCFFALLFASSCRDDRKIGPTGNGAGTLVPAGETNQAQTGPSTVMAIEGCCRLRPPASAEVTRPEAIDVQAVVARGTDYEITMAFERQAGSENPLSRVPVRTIRIDGRNAALWSAEDAQDPSWQTRTLSLQVRPPLRDGSDIMPGDHVTLFARCKTAQACSLAEQIFQTLDLADLRKAGNLH